MAAWRPSASFTTSRADVATSNARPISSTGRGANNGTVASAPKLAAVPISQPRLEPVDILTPEELAQRLKVRVRWVYEAVHGRNPLPCLRCGRYLRFSWPDVVAWMRNGKG